MQEKLVIYLHADDIDCPSWAIVTADGNVRQYAYRDNPLALAQIAEEKEIIILVPTEEVSILSVALPPMNRSRLLQAIPFALEDQLIADVDTLHFALLGNEENGQWSVAVVSHEIMQKWLAQLHSWQIQADSLLPTLACAPYTEDEWHILFHDVLVMRTQSRVGFSCDRDNFPTLLNHILAKVTVKPTKLYLHNYTGCAQEITATLPIEEKRFPKEEWIKHISQAITPAALHFNLLQGQYAVKKSKFPQVKKIWKGNFYLVTIFALLLFLYPLASYFILSKRMSTIDAEIANIYKRHFPQARSLVAPKIRMEEKLRKTAMQMGDNKVFLLLGYVTKALSETPQISLKGFDFQNEQLTAELTAASSEALTQFTDALLQQGLRVKQQNVNLMGERTSASLIIEN